MHPFYLFLDFDGVLHDDGPSPGLFEHAARLADCLAPHPDVRIVVSSMWRETFHLVDLRRLCGEALGPRLHHVTPILERGRFYIGLEGQRQLWADYRGASVLASAGAFDPETPYVRFAEVAMWLAVLAGDGSTSMATVATHALARTDWIAIDDTDFWFPPGCRQLLHVENGAGLQDQHFAEIEVRLRAFREEITHVA